jgi:probable HAF family extracellular repeat protein
VTMCSFTLRMALPLLLGSVAGPAQGYSSITRAVSPDGDVVVGEARNSNGEGRAFRWTAQTGMFDLGTLGGAHSAARFIGPDGAVAGESWLSSSGGFHAFHWTPETGMVDVGTLGGTDSEALGFTPDGALIGVSRVPTGESRIFRWTQADGIRDIGTLGGLYTVASYRDTVTPDGAVIGNSETASGEVHAFRWTMPEGMVDLGTLGGNFVETSTRITIRENDAPTVQVLSARPSSLWPPNHRMVPVSVTFAVADNYGFWRQPRVSLRSNQPDDEIGVGAGATRGDTEGEDGYVAPVLVPAGRIRRNADGSYSAHFQLRAERAARIPGPRVYTVTVEVEDTSGNVASTSTEIPVVPPKGM